MAAVLVSVHVHLQLNMRPFSYYTYSAAALKSTGVELPRESAPINVYTVSVSLVKILLSIPFQRQSQLSRQGERFQ